MRRQRRRATVTNLHRRLPHAYQRDDVRLVRRTTVRRDLLGPPVPGQVRRARWGLSPSWLSHWRHALRLRGLDRVGSEPGGGRRPQWTPRQTKRVGARIATGPLGVGCATACGTASRRRVLRWRAWGVLDKRQDGGTWRPPLGCALHKARFVSDHRDAAQRLAWRQAPWPGLCRAAKRCTGLLLFAEEARVAPWGARSYTWATRGRQPAVPTRGQRKGSTVVGAMEYGSGRGCAQGREGRCHSASDQALRAMRMAHTTAPLGVMPAGAK